MKISIVHLRELRYEEQTENDNQQPRRPVRPHLPLDQVAGSGHRASGAHLGGVDKKRIILSSESMTTNEQMLKECSIKTV